MKVNLYAASDSQFDGSHGLLPVAEVDVGGNDDEFFFGLLYDVEQLARDLIWVDNLHAAFRVLWAGTKDSHLNRWLSESATVGRALT
jgi:hypothetical protein